MKLVTCWKIAFLFPLLQSLSIGDLCIFFSWLVNQSNSKGFPKAMVYVPKVTVYGVTNLVLLTSNNLVLCFACSRVFKGVSNWTYVKKTSLKPSSSDCAH